MVASNDYSQDTADKYHTDPNHTDDKPVSSSVPGWFR